jgi:hypothetical protein
MQLDGQLHTLDSQAAASINCSEYFTIDKKFYKD